MTGIKLFRICNECNKQFEITNASFGVEEVVACFQSCPHCKKENHIWVKVDYLEASKQLTTTQQELERVKGLLEEAIKHTRSLCDGVQYFNRSHGSMNKSLEAYCDAMDFLTKTTKNEE